MLCAPFDIPLEKKATLTMARNGPKTDVDSTKHQDYSSLSELIVGQSQCNLVVRHSHCTCKSMKSSWTLAGGWDQSNQYEVQELGKYGGPVTACGQGAVGLFIGPRLAPELCLLPLHFVLAALNLK